MKQLFLLYNGEKHFCLLARKGRTQLLFADRDGLSLQLQSLSLTVRPSVSGVKSQQTLLIMIPSQFSIQFQPGRLIVFVKVVGNRERCSDHTNDKSQLYITLRLCGCRVPKRS